MQPNQKTLAEMHAIYRNNYCFAIEYVVEEIPRFAIPILTLIYKQQHKSDIQVVVITPAFKIIPLMQTNTFWVFPDFIFLLNHSIIKTAKKVLLYNDYKKLHHYLTVLPKKATYLLVVSRSCCLERIYVAN